MRKTFVLIFTLFILTSCRSFLMANLDDEIENKERKLKQANKKIAEYQKWINKHTSIIKEYRQYIEYDKKLMKNKDLREKVYNAKQVESYKKDIAYSQKQIAKYKQKIKKVKQLIKNYQSTSRVYSQRIANLKRRKELHTFELLFF